MKLTTTPTPYETLRTSLRTGVHENGVTKTVQRYSEPLLREWRDSVTNGDDMTSAETRRRLVVGMGEVISIRDALILATLNPSTPLATLESIASEPHIPENVRRVGAVLIEAFDNPEHTPDAAAMAATKKILVAMIEETGGETETDREYLAQPFAALSYIEWWDNHAREAMRYAGKALAADPNNTLSVIVVTALKRNISPAYIQ